MPTFHCPTFSSQVTVDAGAHEFNGHLVAAGHHRNRPESKSMELIGVRQRLDDGDTGGGAIPSDVLPGLVRRHLCSSAEGGVTTTTTPGEA